MDPRATPGAERHLWQLMQDVARARSLDDIHASALVGLGQILSVERAAVLVLDEAGVMRFAAWKGLSDAYRRAVEGHSPWAPGDVDIAPILVADVRADTSLAGYRDVFDREEIRALAFIPLLFGDRLLGKFMLYYAEPHELGEQELAIARLVAGHVAFALEHRRVERDLAERLRLEQAARTRADELAIDNGRLYDQARKARHSAEEAARRLDVLARASDSLAGSLDPERTLQALAEFAVSTLADYCVAYTVGADGTIRRIGMAHADPAQQPLVEALMRAGPPSLGDPYGAGAVIRTGQPMLVADIPRELLETAAQNAAHLEVLRQLGPRSSIIVPLRARDRTVGALAFATTDTSGRRYGDDDLALAEELASRAALLVDNARLYRDAQAALRGRDEMMAIVSHDLRNPIATIVTACELLELTPPAERRAATHASIRRAARQMSRLLEDLLDVTRIEAGRLSVEQAPVDVAALVADAALVAAPIAEQRAIRLTQRVDEGIGVLLGDRDRLLQALSNLVGNALRFAPAESEISLAATRQGDTIRLSVADRGPGIATEQLPHIFDRFWQGNQQQRSGLGLGLTIARGIAEAHRGTIEVASTWGEGACFTVILPEAAPSARATSAELERRPV